MRKRYKRKVISTLETIKEENESIDQQAGSIKKAFQIKEKKDVDFAKAEVD